MAVAGWTGGAVGSGAAVGFFLLGFGLGAVDVGAVGVAGAGLAAPEPVCCAVARGLSARLADRMVHIRRIAPRRSMGRLFPSRSVLVGLARMERFWVWTAPKFAGNYQKWEVFQTSFLFCYEIRTRSSAVICLAWFRGKC